MCTSISFSRPALYGRNLDLEVSFGERVVITPRDYPFTFHNRPALEHHFAMVGMASVAAGVPLYAEAMNEKGLYLAGLNFPGNAVYFPDGGTPGCVAPYELIPLVLGTCATLDEARALLKELRIIGTPFAPQLPPPRCTGTSPTRPARSPRSRWKTACTSMKTPPGCSRTTRRSRST